MRINGVATAWWEDDLAAAAHADAIIVPKVESADQVQRVAERLPEGVGLEVQIETTRGLIEVERIAAFGPPLETLVFGPGDFAASLGVPVLTIGAGASEYAMARVAVAARAEGDDVSQKITPAGHNSSQYLVVQSGMDAGPEAEEEATSRRTACGLLHSSRVED